MIHLKEGERKRKKNRLTHNKNKRMEIKVLRDNRYKPVAIEKKYNTTKATEEWHEIKECINKPKSMRRSGDPRSIDQALAYARGISLKELKENTDKDVRRLHVFACNIKGGTNQMYFSSGLKRFFRKIFLETPPPARNFYEVIKEGEPCNLYVDIDVPKLPCNAYINPSSLTKDVNNFLLDMMKKTFDIQWDKIHVKSHLIESCGSRKISYHIIIRVFRHCFKNGNEALYAFIKYCWFEALRQEMIASKKIWQYICKEEEKGDTPKHPLTYFKGDDPNLHKVMMKMKEILKRESFFFLNEKGIVECAIDTGIYSRNRLFRFLWNTKPKHPDRVLKPFDEKGNVIPAPTWRRGRGGHPSGFFDSINSVEACFRRHMVTYFPDSRRMSEIYQAFDFSDIAPSIRTLRLSDYILSDDEESLIYIRGDKPHKRKLTSHSGNAHNNGMKENLSKARKEKMVIESSLCRKFMELFMPNEEMKKVVQNVYFNEGQYRNLPPEIHELIERNINDDMRKIDAFIRAEGLDAKFERMLDIKMTRYYPVIGSVTVITGHTTCPFGELEFREGNKMSAQIFIDEKTGIKYYCHGTNHVYFVINLINGTYTLRCRDDSHYTKIGNRKKLNKNTRRKIFQWLRDEK